jgi:hypothetical protein
MNLGTTITKIAFREEHIKFQEYCLTFISKSSVFPSPLKEILSLKYAEV